MSHPYHILTFFNDNKITPVSRYQNECEPVSLMFIMVDFNTNMKSANDVNAG